MSLSEWLVLGAGLAAIAGVIWWFFLAERAAATAGDTGSGSQEVTVVVRGGYEPATIRVRRGVPLRLVFDRQESSGCSEEVVLPAFGVRRFLPAFSRTTVELPSATPGTYDFTCGMSMLRGKLIVE